MVAITGIYAALLAALYIGFSFYVSVTRGRTGVGLGDGGNPAMLVAIRRHGNMGEFVPFALLLMALAEVQGLGGAWLHGAGLLLVAGRLVHPFGIGAEGGIFPARVAGTLATYAAMLLPGVYLLGALAG